MSLSPLNKNSHIGVLGLGYVGLPLAHAFGFHFRTSGFDINEQRITEIQQNFDRNRDLSKEILASGKTQYSQEIGALADCDIYIVTAPTPVDKQNQPDLEPVLGAARLIAGMLKKGDLVIFESTVYPGATEEECVPVLEQVSGLRFNEDFYVGYSPERINPGDKAHSLPDVVKVTSGSTSAAADKVDKLYGTIITAGTHRASSIKVAEAAKVIENTQRDLNIALVNELAILFEKLGINTKEVLDAAGSKWNFLPFFPGLVGGHCIGVDPYYLTYWAKQVGYHPDVILAGRRINDSMGEYVAERVIRLMLSKRIHIIDAKILVMGLAFKENCPDTRNSRVIDVITTLQGYNVQVSVLDPWVDTAESDLLVEEAETGAYDAIIIAVAHKQFKQLSIEDVRAMGKEQCVIFDVKHMFPASDVDGSL